MGAPSRFVTPQLEVRDVAADAIYAEYRKSGAEIVDDIETKPWAMREFTIRDPDGNRFRIGHGDGTPAGELPEMTVFE